jgi:predicted ABC-type ATPase
LTKENLRLRVFAGPNGSGKSTIIHALRSREFNAKPLDFGVYVNADDIAKALAAKTFRFEPYEVTATKEDFVKIAIESGLIKEDFIQQQFLTSFKFEDDTLLMEDSGSCERIAQILADYLRKKLVAAKRKFSFETVFSHESKLDIMKIAAEAGYKVYLYFVSTESADVNKYRVGVRVKEGGHNVPQDKIFSRYTRSLEFLHEAAQLTYQTFFFDNSNPLDEDQEFKPFAQFRVKDGKKDWTMSSQNSNDLPRWFIKYYYDKIKQPPAGSKHNEPS